MVFEVEKYILEIITKYKKEKKRKNYCHTTTEGKNDHFVIIIGT